MYSKKENLERIFPSTLKMKELASITRSTFSAGDFHSADHRLAAAGCLLLEFVCQVSTRIFGRRVK